MEVPLIGSRAGREGRILESVGEQRQGQAKRRGRARRCREPESPLADLQEHPHKAESKRGQPIGLLAQERREGRDEGNRDGGIRTLGIDSPENPCPA